MKKEIQKKGQTPAPETTEADEHLTPFVPTYKNLLVTMGAILAVLIVVFFVGNIILKPYMVKVDMRITPWLDNSKAKTSILGI
ncbi:MAG: hypothetical protein LBB93_02450 [Elusimicrobiota bacterium]|jgi:hypothetical protein|nr:hypothetical protein [Elusimicrobiota bacterium]